MNIFAEFFESLGEKTEKWMCGRVCVYVFERAEQNIGFSLNIVIWFIFCNMKKKYTFSFIRRERETNF